MPLAVGLEETSVTVDTGRLAANSGGGQIQVIASDGLNCTSALVEDILIQEDKLPQLELVQPDSDAYFAEESLVTLQAAAFDSEDGALDGDAIDWQSDQDGFLGLGATLQTSGLSVGKHTLTATALDSVGNFVQQSVIVHITVNELL